MNQVRDDVVRDDGNGMLNQYRVGARHDVVQHDEKARLRVEPAMTRGMRLRVKPAMTGRRISGVGMACGAGMGLLCGFGGKYVFESGSGFGEGHTQGLSNELGREGLLIAIKLVLLQQFCDQNPLIIYGIALSLLCDVLAPLRDCQE